MILENKLDITDSKVLIIVIITKAIPHLKQVICN